MDKPDPAPDGGELDEAEEARRELDTRINWLSNVDLRGVKAVSALSSA
ncbi:MAG: hypothetical protein ING25_00045 [Burkholderiales bacterium]|nr:hypothetical protein [Burkholderiales bacterium]MCA3171432.1 hypothetical protein [Burkholderiales bacterium]